MSNVQGLLASGKFASTDVDGPSYPYPTALMLLYYAIITILTLYAFGYVADKLDRRRKKFPILGDSSWWYRRAWFLSRSSQDMVGLVMEGYHKYNKHNEIWATWIFDQLFYVCPKSLLDEVKSLPPSTASFMGLVDEIFMWSAHTGDTLKGRDHITGLKKHLIPNLPDMIESMAQNVDSVLAARLTCAKDARGWKVAMVWDCMLDISYRLMCPMLIGSQLGHSEDFVCHASDYTKTIPVWTAMKFMLPPFLYGSSFWVLPIGRTIRHHLREVRKLVVPEVRHLFETPHTDSKRIDVMKGLVELSQSRGDGQNAEEIVNQMLFVLFAGADLFSVLLCQLIYNMMEHQEYLKEIKEEIESAVEGSSGWNKAALAKMPKFDSFVRETLRLSPPICCTVQRKIMKEVCLSNGTILKPGDNVMFPTFTTLRDPDTYPDPHKFDPYRFLNPERNAVLLHSETQTKDFAVFGYGNQACPGRFYVVTASKLVLARLIVDYDMKFVPERRGKPVDFPRGIQILPNMDTFLAFRRKKKTCGL